MATAVVSKWEGELTESDLELNNEAA